MSNIYLVGMMGSGKSVTARALGSKLGRVCVDLDEKVEAKMGFTIAEAFDRHGEDYFRDQEVLVLQDVSSSGNQIIATGGGVIKRAENIDCMKNTGIVIYLEATLDTLWNRVGSDLNRPLLRGDDSRGKLEKIYHSRKMIYEAICQFSVSTDGLSAEETADKILEKLEVK